MTSTSRRGLLKAATLDGLIVATPEHTHAVISARAMRRGKHVFCEKPIAHDVAEARGLRRIAKETGVATQMGNPGMATDSFRRAVELIEDGVLGELREAHVWYVFGGGGPRQRPQESQPVPERLDWDVWLGPARFTDDGLKTVAGWHALESLDVEDTRITDAGLTHLSALTELKRLNLTGTRITDAGLTHLRGLASLQALQLSGTGVTAAGLADFLRSHPGATVSPDVRRSPN
jgi:hypothetical protein